MKALLKFEPLQQLQPFNFPTKEKEIKPIDFNITCDWSITMTSRSLPKQEMVNREMRSISPLPEKNL